MSKRLKNYPPPDAILSKYGADALRLYLISSPVVRAEPLRFKVRSLDRVLVCRLCKHSRTPMHVWLWHFILSLVHSFGSFVLDPFLPWEAASFVV